MASNFSQAQYIRIVADTLIDLTQAARSGHLKEQDAAFRLCLDLVRDREEHHERESEYASSKLYDAGVDMAKAYGGSE